MESNHRTYRKRLGQSIWLLLLLANFTPPDWDGETPTWVAGGNVVSDVEISARLGVSQKTISKWRSKLRAAGVLGWHVSLGKGRAYWVGGVNTALVGKVAEVQPAQSSDVRRISTAAAIWRVVEERSIALTGKSVQDLSPDEASRVTGALAGEIRLPTKVSE